MILADTSAWVEYDRGSGSRAERRITQLIRTDRDLAVTEPVLMEVLAGAKDSGREADLRRLLLRFHLLRFDAVVDFEAAAKLYRRCRSAGVRPPGMIDCMIAAVALRTGASLLSWDADMDRLASVAGLELDRASLRA